MSEKLPKLNSARFTDRNGADSNRVFLITHCAEPPFLKAVDGWKIIGYGRAPWPKGDSGFALMLEKQTPADHTYPGSKGEDFEMGDTIWHHWSESFLRNWEDALAED